MGKCTEYYARALHRCNSPCIIIMTLRKLKTTMPSLKPFRSGVMYKITCPRSEACHVGQTSRHLQTRFREHVRNAGPMRKHQENCDVKVREENVEALASSISGKHYLLTLEALWIRELKPSINTRDEYRSRTNACYYEASYERHRLSAVVGLLQQEDQMVSTNPSNALLPPPLPSPPPPF